VIGASVIVVDALPGGLRLHKHPYAELFVLLEVGPRSRRART